MRSISRAGAAILLGSLLVIGCSGGADSSDAASPESATGATAAAELVLAQGEADGRQVIRTAELAVRVGAVGPATARATQLARDAGGFVHAETIDLDDDEARLTLKVPTGRFEELIESLTGLGRALRRDLATEDVTAEVVDVEARLASARASVERLRGLLAGAGSVGDLIAVEGELAERQAGVESLEGRQRLLRNRVDLATVDLLLVERAELEVSDDLPGFLKSLRNGWIALVNVLLALSAAAGFLLPFLPLIVVALWLGRRHLRHRRQRPRPPRPPAPNPPTARPPAPGGPPGAAQPVPPAPPPAPPPPAPPAAAAAPVGAEPSPGRRGADRSRPGADHDEAETSAPVGS